MHTAGRIVQKLSGLHQVGIFPKIRTHLLVFGFRSRLKSNRLAGEYISATPLNPLRRWFR
jgi:hypothetical protein